MRCISTLSLFVLVALGGCDGQSDTSQWVDLLGPETSKQWVTVGTNDLRPAWSIKDGVLALSEGGGGDVTNGVIYSDFELELEWRISKGGNSGIFFMANQDVRNTPVWTSALEMQILDDVNHDDNKTALTRAGSTYALYPAIAGTAKPYDEWNKARIRVDNGVVTQWLNGTEIAQFDIASDDFRARVMDSKFRDFQSVFAQSERGLIVLQDHQDPVAFRHVRIRELNR